MTNKYTPRIYVACLAAYNNGFLHGKWIDCDQSAEEIHEEIQEMLKESPINSELETAEEWEIHDTDDEIGLRLERMSIEDIAEAVDAINSSHHDAGLIGEVYNHLSIETIPEVVEWMDDNYSGEHDSLADYAESWLEDTGSLEGVPKDLRYYFDFDKWAREEEINGRIFTLYYGGKHHVFFSN